MEVDKKDESSDSGAARLEKSFAAKNQYAGNGQDLSPSLRGERLYSRRETEMEKANKANNGSMAAVLNASIEDIESIISSTTGVLVVANYNTEKQIVISGEDEEIIKNYNPLDIAKIFIKNDAPFLSVLTEEDFFLGSFIHLSKIKQKIDLPILCKDFFFDKFQVHLAKSYGADAILIILAGISEDEANQLYEEALNLNTVLLYTSDAADERSSVDLGGRRIIKKKKKKKHG